MLSHVIAGHRSNTTVDLYELCGWGDSSQHVPNQALKTTRLCPSTRSIIFPSGWRHQQIWQLLHHAVDTNRSWKRISSITLHFHALSPSSAAALAALAPNLTQLILSLDLAFEQTKSQAWRIGALQQLQQLASLTVEVDLRPEALRALASLPKLQQLQLVQSRHNGSHPAASLEALVALTRLTLLRFHWQAGR